MLGVTTQSLPPDRFGPRRSVGETARARNGCVLKIVSAVTTARISPILRKIEKTWDHQTSSSRKIASSAGRSRVALGIQVFHPR